MKIIERYFIVDNEGHETRLGCEMTYTLENIGEYSDTRIELLKVRDEELKLSVSLMGSK